MSSHILSEISAVCDDVLILSHGRLVACDTTENLGKLMEDRNTLHLTVKGEEEDIRRVLSSVDGVERVDIVESQEKGCLDVVVQSDSKVDVREVIFYGLAAVQCPIYAMDQVKKSLEDVFIELTADDHVPAADGEEADSHDSNL